VGFAEVMISHTFGDGEHRGVCLPLRSNIGGGGAQPHGTSVTMQHRRVSLLEERRCLGHRRHGSLYARSQQLVPVVNAPLLQRRSVAQAVTVTQRLNNEEPTATDRDSSVAA